MTPSRYRAVLAVLSVVLLISAIYGLSLVSSSPDPGNKSYLQLVTIIVLGLNVPILYLWFSFAVPAAIIISVISALIVLFMDFRMRLYGYSFYTISYIVASFVGYLSARSANAKEGACNLKLEKLDEDMNILVNSIEEKKRDISSLEEKMRRYSTLREAAESLGTALSVDDINRLIIENTLKTLGKAGRALLFLIDQEKQELVLSSSWNALRVKTKKGDVFDRWILKNRKSLIIEDVSTDFRFPAGDIEEAKGAFGSLIAAPLMSENKLVGIIRIDNRKPSFYTHDDLRLLDVIADLGALAIQNSYLYSRAKDLAIKDGLTGLTVRRHFMERFNEELKRSDRKKRPLSLLILDIDRFKDYNDRYGHAAGDLVLKYMAKTVSAMVREADMVVRYGGEEIGILLYGRTRQEAAAEAEKIRKNIKDRPFVLRRQQAQLTVSIGLSAYPEDAVSEEELIRIADERLYKAKAEGRDRVCSQ